MYEKIRDLIVWWIIIYICSFIVAGIADVDLSTAVFVSIPSIWFFYLIYKDHDERLGSWLERRRVLWAKLHFIDKEATREQRKRDGEYDHEDFEEEFKVEPDDVLRDYPN